MSQTHDQVVDLATAAGVPLDRADVFADEVIELVESQRRVERFGWSESDVQVTPPPASS